MTSGRLRSIPPSVLPRKNVVPYCAVLCYAMPLLQGAVFMVRFFEGEVAQDNKAAG